MIVELFVMQNIENSHKTLPLMSCKMSLNCIKWPMLTTLLTTLMTSYFLLKNSFAKKLTSTQWLTHRVNFTFTLPCITMSVRR